MRKEINVKRNEEREGGKKRRQKVKGDGGKERCLFDDHAFTIN